MRSLKKTRDLHKQTELYKGQNNIPKETVSVTEKMFVMFHMYKQHLEINMVSLFICCIMFLSCIEFISLAQMVFLPMFSIFFGKSFCVSFMVNGGLIYRSRIKNKIKPKEYFSQSKNNCNIMAFRILFGHRKYSSGGRIK